MISKDPKDSRQEFLSFLKGLKNKFIEELILGRLKQIDDVGLQNQVIDDFLLSRQNHMSTNDKMKKLA